MGSPGLLPCPFCGGEARVEEVAGMCFHGPEYEVQCQRCYALSGADPETGCMPASARDAARLWNTRIGAQGGD